MKYTHNAATGFLGKDHRNQIKEKFHCTFSIFLLKLKLYKAGRFLYAREIGGVLQPDELEEVRTGGIN